MVESFGNSTLSLVRFKKSSIYILSKFQKLTIEFVCIALTCLKKTINPSNYAMDF